MLKVGHFGSKTTLKAVTSLESEQKANRLKGSKQLFFYSLFKYSRTIAACNRRLTLSQALLPVFASLCACSSSLSSATFIFISRAVGEVKLEH